MANFGVDADLYANTPTTFPGVLPTGFVCAFGSDDWFDSLSVFPGTGTGIISLGLTRASSISGLAYTQRTVAGWHTYFAGASGTGLKAPFEAGPNFNPFDPGHCGVINLDAVAARDDISGNDKTSFTGGVSKNGSSPLLWNLTWANQQPKNEIVDGGGHIRAVFDPNTGLPHLYGFGFATTLSTSGTSYLDFEIFRNTQDASGNPVTPTFPVGSTASAITHPLNTGPAFWGGHIPGVHNADGSVAQPGDVLISVNYANGGSAVTYTVYVWVNQNRINLFDPGPAINLTQFNTLANRPFDFTGVFEAGDVQNGVPAGFGYAEIRPRFPDPAAPCNGAVVYAKTNTLTQAAPWGSLSGNNPSYDPQIQSLQLLEFGIDFETLGLGFNTLLGSSNPCANIFGTLVIKTRASTSFSSTLSDYMGPFLFGAFSTVNIDVTADRTVLDCTNSTALLTATYTPPYARIRWYDAANNTLAMYQPTLSVSTPGWYYVSATDTVFGGCIKVDSIQITANTTPPTVSCSADHGITCTTSSATLSANATASAGNTITGYSWHRAEQQLHLSTLRMLLYTQ